MGQITKITAQKRRGRYNIFLDGEYAFPVSETTLVNYQLAKGMTLTPAEEAQIKDSEVVAMGLEIGLNYINHQSRTRHEVKERLAKEEFPEDVISQILQRLTELGFLNDAEYVQRYLEANSKMGEAGPRMVRHKLEQKGIAADLLTEQLAAIPSTTWTEAAVRAGQKNLRHHQNRAFKDQLQRLRVALIQKGFDEATIAAAIEILDPQPDAESELALLKAEAAKQWRLKQHYEARIRKQKVKSALFRKGFDLDAIDDVLADLAEED
ncbi:recombination regulator RecX [Lacticaseibacillus casei]|jgi:regulatory protein|uniref:recombination regulator RecX n=1 Tax=Lacticaseibacillus TaxID=2759736 RepID=UPI000668239F|nr:MULTISPECIES: recombination regulator RecX [Lacticaseibacillus]QVI37511.1 recombination regulator RecX [Lacticaseibacillus casei]QXG59299.1 recombination regulator RecX [Lacticaseibacillus casei]WFB40945.1 recombination regulator RecX [Lacticaseibacillus huelsenbergensis]